MRKQQKHFRIGQKSLLGIFKQRSGWVSYDFVARPTSLEPFWSKREISGKDGQAMVRKPDSIWQPCLFNTVQYLICACIWIML